MITLSTTTYEVTDVKTSTFLLWLYEIWKVVMSGILSHLSSNSPKLLNTTLDDVTVSNKLASYRN